MLKQKQIMALGGDLVYRGKYLYNTGAGTVTSGEFTSRSAAAEWCTDKCTGGSGNGSWRIESKTVEAAGWNHDSSGNCSVAE